MARTPAAESGNTASALQPRSLQPAYTIKVGLNGEVYPVFANFASQQRPDDRNWGTVDITIANHTASTLENRIAVKVLGWSDQEVRAVEVDPGEVRTFLFAPTFYPRLYRNRQTIVATARVTVSDARGRPLFTRTLPIPLRSADDIYWGPHFEYAPFLASWITPHDPQVEKILARARQFAPGRHLPGYERGNNLAQQQLSTYMQARAVYLALQAAGVSYVKSPLTSGTNASERLRMPSESLRLVSASCIDGAVLYASLFESLGMEPEIVLVPHHAYVGVRVAPESEKYLLLETSLTGRARFAAAVRAAEAGIKRYTPAQIVRIPISQAREVGIYPLPGFSPTALDVRSAVSAAR